MSEHSKFDFIPSAFIGTCEIEKEIVIKGIKASEVLAKSANTLGAISDEGDYLKITKPIQITGQITSEPAEFNLDLTYLSDDTKNDQVVTLAWMKQFMVSLGYFSGGAPDGGDAVAISADLLKYIDDKDALRLLKTEANDIFAKLNEFLDFKSATGRQLTNLNSIINGQVENTQQKFVIQDQFNTSLYNKSTVDTLLGAKASTTDLTASQTSLSNALATKLDVSAFTIFQNQNTNTINMKHSISDFNTYVTATGVTLASKLSTSDFNSFVTNNTAAINSKVSSTDYTSFLASNTAAINLKLDASTYTTNKTATDTLISTKAPQSTTYTKTETDGKVSAIQTSLDSYKASNDLLVNSKVDTSTYTANKTATDSLIATKAPQSTTYTKIETDGKVNAVQASLDGYRTSNDAAVQDRITNATFQAYDATIVNNFAGVQNQINQRLKISDFDTFRTTNKQYIDAAQASLLAGPGLTRTDSTFSVNADQPGITSVGALTSLNVQGASTFAQPLTLPIGDSLRFTRSSGSTGQMLIGSDATSNEIFNFKHMGGSGEMLFTTAANGKVSFNTPTINILGTTDTSSSTTGALKLNGGMGIAKSLFVGGELNINNSTGSRLKLQTSNNFFFVGGVANDQAGDFHIYDATASSRLIGWYRSDNSLRFGNYSGATNVFVTGTADSTSTSTGALQVVGGVGISKSLYVGGNGLRVDAASGSAISVGGTGSFGMDYPGVGNGRLLLDNAGDMTLGRGILTIANTTESTSTTSGAVKVAGGVGIAKNLNVGGNAAVTGTLTASNVKGASVAATFSQSGVTWTNVTTSVCNYSKVGQNVIASYEFVWQNQSGNANGQFTFSLPFPPKNTTLMKSVMLGDGNSYASNSGGMTEYMCKFTALGNNAVLYSNLAANLPAGTGSGGISFTIYYYANS